MMATYVLVPGFFFGAGIWDEVADALRAGGHEVHAVTPTGVGERAGEATPDVDADTHIADILEVIEGRDLREVVLVLHSGATIAGTEAADRVPGRLRRIVYVDTAPFPDGMAQVEFYPPDKQREERRRAEEEGGGWLLPPRPFDAADQASDPQVLGGLGERELAYLRKTATPQPARLAFDPARRPAVVPETPKTLIACTFPVEQVRRLRDAGVPSFSMLAGDEWSFAGLPTGHWPMLSRPKELAALLEEAAS